MQPGQSCPCRLLWSRILQPIGTRQGQESSPGSKDFHVPGHSSAHQVRHEDSIQEKSVREKHSALIHVKGGFEEKVHHSKK